MCRVKYGLAACVKVSRAVLPDWKNGVSGGECVIKSPFNLISSPWALKGLLCPLSSTPLKMRACVRALANIYQRALGQLRPSIWLQSAHRCAAPMLINGKILIEELCSWGVFLSFFSPLILLFALGGSVCVLRQAPWEF